MSTMKEMIERNAGKEKELIHEADIELCGLFSDTYKSVNHMRPRGVYFVGEVLDWFKWYEAHLPEIEAQWAAEEAQWAEFERQQKIEDELYDQTEGKWRAEYEAEQREAISLPFRKANRMRKAA